jgi:hypothetical protein
MVNKIQIPRPESAAASAGCCSLRLSETIWSNDVPAAPLHSDTGEREREREREVDTFYANARLMAADVHFPMDYHVITGMIPH